MKLSLILTIIPLIFSSASVSAEEVSCQKFENLAVNGVVELSDSLAETARLQNAA